MEDTTFTVKGKRVARLTGSFKACLLYVIADACVSLGQEFSSMDQAQWSKMWVMQKLGFWLSQIGSTALMVKAFYSGSSPNRTPNPPIT